MRHQSDADLSDLPAGQEGGGDQRRRSEGPHCSAGEVQREGWSFLWAGQDTSWRRYALLAYPFPLLCHLASLH